MNTNYSDKRKLIEKAVLSAAAHLLEASKSNAKIEVTSKPDYTIVMNLDLECQKKIKAVLDGTIPVLAEEDETSHKIIGNEYDYFIVDPIDGTASCRRYLGTEGGQIGYGPLAGFVEKGKLKVSVYYNIPTNTLYSAVYGEGAYAITSDPLNEMPELEARRKLYIDKPCELNQSAVLFYPGSMQELTTVMHLRTNGLVENTYRLGGFANDSIRIAENFEQVQLQTRVKAWDFPSTLISKEAGLRVILDPFGKRIEFDDWVIRIDNPVLIAHGAVMQKLLDNLKSA